MAQANIDVAALDEAFARTRALAALPNDVAQALRRAVLELPDRELFRINPLRFAAEHGLDEARAIDAMIAGSRAGLFEMRWGLTCPWCGLYVSQMPRLSQLDAEFWCVLCDQTTRTVLDAAVEVSFSISPTVRQLALHEHALADSASMMELYRNPAARLSPGLATVLRDYAAFHAVPAGGETFDPRPRCERELYRIASVTHDINAELALEAGQTGLDVRLEPRAVQLQGTSRPGLRIANTTSEPAFVGELCIPREVFGTIGEQYPATFGPRLTGKQLLCRQVFRDLYGAETLGAGIALTLESIAILFTDLKGSTAMYDAVGDVRAFELVTDHFKLLLGSVHASGGAVVKTIGDAVMAAFPEPRLAVQAAFDMGARMRDFNSTSGRPPLALKVGVHAGPCIAVSSNQRLDYFGQTVNVAARVQALAEGDELVISDAVRSARGIEPLLSDRRVRSGPVHVKGVAGELVVHTTPLA